MKHFETIIAQGTPTGASAYELLGSFPGASSRIREHNGKAYPVSLVLQTNNVGNIPSRLSVKFDTVSRERYGLEYNANFPTSILDVYTEEDLLFLEGEEVIFQLNSGLASMWLAHLSVYYTDCKPLFKNRFINYTALGGMKKRKVVKTSDVITLTGSGGPVWKPLSEFVGSWNGSTYYALCGGTSNYYQGTGFAPNPYPLILTGKFNGNRFLTLPMNSLNNPPDLCKDYFLTMSRFYGNADTIPVIRGDEMQNTMFELYGDSGGADGFVGSLHFFELLEYQDARTL